MTQLVDQDARNAALSDFQRNLVVVAGAGTGKTSLLVGRLCTALVRLRMEPHEVLALTFTENAATEMRERLVRLLRAVGPWLDGAPLEDESDRHALEVIRPGPEDRRRVADVLEMADDLPISTFHGFCLRLLQRHAHRLDLPPEVRLGDAESMRADWSRAFLRFLQVQDKDRVHPALERFDPAELRALGFCMLSLPDDLLELPTVQPAAQDLRARRAELEGMCARYPKALARFRACAQDLLAACDRLLGGEGVMPRTLPRVVPGPGAGVLAGERPAVVQRVQDHLDHLRPFVLGDDVGVAIAVEFLRPLVASYRRDRLVRGELTFDDLLLLVRQHLMADAGFRRRVGSSLRAILVDEFQDTDPLQYDVVFLLAAAEVAGRVERPMASALRENVLFIVGDAKQSIYRFRRADVAAFSHASARILDQGGRRLCLVSNFRCVESILALVNDVCGPALAEDPPYQFGYEPVVATRGAGREPVVEVLVPEQPTKIQSDARRRLEGDLVVQQIDRLRREGAAFGTIAVLLRAAADTRWLLRPLRAASVPYVLEGSRRFWLRQEVVTATALITAVARPHDSVPVLGVLRSALCEATDRQILEYARRASFDFRRPRHGQGPVPRTLDFLADLHARTRGLPVDRAVEILLGLDAFTIGEGAGYEGAQRLANLERLCALLVAQGHADLGEVADFLERRTVRETEDEESPLYDSDVDAVRIMTVHAAKGLEFGAVILPDLARLAHGGEPREDAKVERLSLCGGREIVGIRIGSCRNVASYLAEAENKAHRLAEERRLFYVAATRAKDRLTLLCARHTDSRSLWQKDLFEARPDLGPPDGRMVAITATDPLRSAGEVAPERVLAAFSAHRDLVARLAASATPKASTPSAGAVGVPEPPLFAAARTRAAGAERAPAAELGRAVHRYLALCDLGRDRVDAALCEGLGAELCGAELRDGELREIVESFHGSALIRRIRAAHSLRREVPIAFVDGAGRSVRGVIDLLLGEPRDDDGTKDGFTVVDYKTDRVLGSSFEAAAERYRPQLLLYGEGVQRALSLERPPRLEVWFVRHGRTVRLC